MTNLSLRTIYVFSNCFLEKVCCGGLIFAARRPWNWTVGPKVILNLGKYIPIFRDGGIFGTMLCIKGGSPPPGLQPQTPFLWHSAILRRLCGGVWCGVAYLEYLLICSGVAKPPQATPTIVISEGNKSGTFKKSFKWKAFKCLWPSYTIPTLQAIQTWFPHGPWKTLLIKGQTWDKALQIEICREEAPHISSVCLELLKLINSPGEEIVG